MLGAAYSLGSTQILLQKLKRMLVYCLFHRLVLEEIRMDKLKETSKLAFKGGGVALKLGAKCPVGP